VDEEQEGPSHYDPVTCTGLQPGSDVFVFGPKLQISAVDGSVIPPDQQRFIWIEHILQKLQRPVNPLSSIQINPNQHHLNVLIKGIHTIAGDNVVSGLYLLGKSIILCPTTR